MRQKRIMYAIDEDTGLVVSQVGDQYAWPVLEYARMLPENNFETVYGLEKLSIFEVGNTVLRPTRDISNKTKNVHRKFWGMKELPA